MRAKEREREREIERERGGERERERESICEPLRINALDRFLSPCPANEKGSGARHLSGEYAYESGYSLPTEIEVSELWGSSLVVSEPGMQPEGWALNPTEMAGQALKVGCSLWIAFHTPKEPFLPPT